jgi:hypothetical protein
MVNYEFGKVYKIIGNGLLYVGSTTKLLLYQRFSEHIRRYKYWLNGKGNYISSFKCLVDPNCYIELLELCPCHSNDELRICENKWIQELNCVNQNNAVDKTIELRAKKISKKNKESDNYQVISKKKQNYNQENIEEISKKKFNKFFYNCDACNYTTTRDSQRKRHEMTSKHKLLIKKKINESNANICECGKKYAFASGLCLHKKTCIYLKNKSSDDYMNQIIMKLLKDNEEIKQMIIEQNKQQIQNMMQQQQFSGMF